MSETPTNNPVKLVSPKFRGSFVHAFKAQAIGKGTPKFSITMILPKGVPASEEFKTKLKRRFEGDMMEKFGKILPDEALKHYPIKDGDTYVDNDGETRPEYKGAWVIKAANERAPGVMVLQDDNSRIPAEPREIYSGAWYVISITTFAWSNENGRGVSVSLSGILKVAEGDKFSASDFSENDFAGVTREAVGSTMEKPTAPAAPPAKPKAAGNYDDL